MENDKILTTNQVAEILGVSLRRVQALIADGRLPSQQIGREHLIKASDVKLVENRTVGRPSNRWKGYTLFFSEYDSRYKVEFVSGMQQARGYNEPPKRVPDFPAVIIDLSGDEPTFVWKLEPNTNEHSLNEFQQKALDFVRKSIGSE